ncbi:glycosyltransferase family protein [Paenarthrobacter sp. Z7-10]|uniref:glycosyltransferase family protein n=1 Tax=Paenarthrobacter sp. Z7-10 TaxID=2787635 RepID=UPI0022A9A189|nr:glycosyltransferase [Paenarthrobacter sp. Z7-10]
MWTGRGQKRRLAFAEAILPLREPRRTDVKVAVILDDFSLLAFAYEWDTVLVNPATWRRDLENAGIDLLFVESAWSGNGGLWRGKISADGGPDDSFKQLLEWCGTREIPTVFWNKEDPPHYRDFLPAAKLFDHVFTSDQGRVSQYRSDLQHDRIAVLPFAAQPAIHNPIRPTSGWHHRDVAFAGMYFVHKYPERRQQMELVLGGALDASARMPIGLEIFSRQLGGGADYQFPPPLTKRVVGALTYPQMLTAYKAYRVFLNVNSVADSTSMCARRIFEISASGTPVITAPSAAVGNFFSPREVAVAETRLEAEHLCRAFVENVELNDRTSHMAQRRIWQQHTYAHRAEHVLMKALPGKSRQIQLPTVSVLVSTIRPNLLDDVFGTVARQRGVDVQLVLLTHGFELSASRFAELKRQHGLDNVVLLCAPRSVPLGDCLNTCVEASAGEVLTKMDDDDHYGQYYLQDQLFALEYANADIVGKQAHYMHLKATGATILRFASMEHRFTDFVVGPTIMARREAMRANPFPALGLGEDTGFLRAAGNAGMKIYSSDRFNYYQLRSGSGHTWKMDDAALLAAGHVKFYGEPREHVDF